MDVVLGAAVTGPAARLALVDGSSGDRREVIDESTVDLGSDPAQELAAAIIGTQRLLLDDGHQLAAARVCWSDAGGMQVLREKLAAAGISDVASVRQSDAALAKVREVSGGALLFCDDDTATLSIVDANHTAATTVWASEKVADSDSAAACRTLLSRLSKECGVAQNVFLMGTSPNIGDIAKQIRGQASVPLMIPDDTDLAFAHGATLADLGADYLGATSATGVEPENSLDAMGLAQTSLSPQIGQQLAYSMVDDSGSLPMLKSNGNHDPGGIPLQSRMSPLSYADDDDEDDDDPIAAGGVAARPRLVMLGSAAAAVVVIAFASLAITVALGIQPSSASPSTVSAGTLPRVLSMPSVPQFLPLPINPTAPLEHKPEIATPQISTATAVLAGPGGSGHVVTGPAVLPGGDAPMVIPAVSDGPRMPGWGMPGFAMPPVFVPVAPPFGFTAIREWQWIRDSNNNVFQVPTQALTTNVVPGGAGSSTTGLTPTDKSKSTNLPSTQGGNTTSLPNETNGKGLPPNLGGGKDTPPILHGDLPPPAMKPELAPPPGDLPPPAMKPELAPPPGDLPPPAMKPELAPPPVYKPPVQEEAPPPTRPAPRWTPQPRVEAPPVAPEPPPVRVPVVPRFEIPPRLQLPSLPIFGGRHH